MLFGPKRNKLFHFFYDEDLAGLMVRDQFKTELVKNGLPGGVFARQLQVICCHLLIHARSAAKSVTRDF